MTEVIPNTVFSCKIKLSNVSKNTTRVGAITYWASYFPWECKKSMSLFHEPCISCCPWESSLRNAEYKGRFLLVSSNKMKTEGSVSRIGACRQSMYLSNTCICHHFESSRNDVSITPLAQLDTEVPMKLEMGDQIRHWIGLLVWTTLFSHAWVWYSRVSWPWGSVSNTDHGGSRIFRWSYWLYNSE